MMIVTFLAGIVVGGIVVWVALSSHDSESLSEEWRWEQVYREGKEGK
jgi:hypothetical protein